VVKEAPMYEVHGDEILIKNEAIAIQPFDARVRHDAYININYPFILGGTLAGTIVAVGENVKILKVGDRVVSDTPVYKARETRYGGWQKYVVGREGLSAKIGNALFDQAVALPFPLQTAVGALHVYLGMLLPGQAPASAADEKVLIWGAGGSVGGYAVQFAKSVGYTVIATASPRGFAHLKSLGASQVLDYKSPTILDDLRAIGPFKYMYTTSGDPTSQQALASLLQPEGGKFASTLGGDVELPSNVERVYEFFGNVTQKEGAKFEEFAKWWYGEFLGKAIVDGSIEPTPITKVVGGLAALQAAADEMLEGRVKGKPVLNPQDG